MREIEEAKMITREMDNSICRMKSCLNDRTVKFQHRRIDMMMFVLGIMIGLLV